MKQLHKNMVRIGLITIFDSIQCEWKQFMMRYKELSSPTSGFDTSQFYNFTRPIIQVMYDTIKGQERIDLFMITSE